MFGDRATLSEGREEGTQFERKMIAVLDDVLAVACLECEVGASVFLSSGEAQHTEGKDCSDARTELYLVDALDACVPDFAPRDNHARAAAFAYLRSRRGDGHSDFRLAGDRTRLR